MPIEKLKDIIQHPDILHSGVVYEEKEMNYPIEIFDTRGNEFKINEIKIYKGSEKATIYIEQI